MARTRRTPEVGGGPPALTSGMVGTGSVSLEMSEHAEEMGRLVQEEVAAQVRLLPDDRAVRQLGRLAHDFPDIALRTPEFFDGMEFLRQHREHGAISRIIGEARRGRRFESQFYLVDLMDRVIIGENCLAAEAAKRVFDRHGSALAKSALSIENDYSRYKRHYDLRRSPKYVSGDRLTPAGWTRYWPASATGTHRSPDLIIEAGRDPEGIRLAFRVTHRQSGSLDSSPDWRPNGLGTS